MSKKKILFVFGTRPEAIKMLPVVAAFKKEQRWCTVKVCVTAQHRKMLDQVLNFFDIIPDYDLDLMQPDQTLFDITSKIILLFQNVLNDFKPDYVIVHGDTTTTMSASLSAFYSGITVCHIEAGLRTYNKKAPFPEEINRQITGRIADIHFAPTEESKKNLLKENIPEYSITITGNTVIDALFKSLEKIKQVECEEISMLKQKINLTKKIILVTGHRRENFGNGFLNICKALKEIAQLHQDLEIVYPVHLNPNVKRPVYEFLKNISNIKLIDPLFYPAFVWLMDKSYLIITDSGGVQEEAPSLGKPVLVTREITERPEAVQAGTVKLVGNIQDNIVKEANILLKDRNEYKKMSLAHNPYGDGKASERIVDFLKNYKNEK